MLRKVSWERILYLGKRGRSAAWGPRRGRPARGRCRARAVNGSATGKAQLDRRGPSGGGVRSGLIRDTPRGPWHGGSRVRSRSRGRPRGQDQRTVERLGGWNPDRLADPELRRRRHLVAVGLPQRLVESARPVVLLRDRKEVLAAGDGVGDRLDEIARVEVGRAGTREARSARPVLTLGLCGGVLAGSGVGQCGPSPLPRGGGRIVERVHLGGRGDGRVG